MPRTIADVLAHADELSARFEAEPAGSVTYGDALAKLRTAVLTRAAAERSVLASVADARQQGHSWNTIGAMMGTTGEAARQRYRDAEAVAPAKATMDDEQVRILAEAGFTLEELRDFAGTLRFGAVLAEAGLSGLVAEIHWTSAKIEAVMKVLAHLGFSQEPPPGWTGGPEIRLQPADMDPLPFTEEGADHSHEARC